MIRPEAVDDVDDDVRTAVLGLSENLRMGEKHRRAGAPSSSRAISSGSPSLDWARDVDTPFAPAALLDPLLFEGDGAIHHDPERDVGVGRTNRDTEAKLGAEDPGRSETQSGPDSRERCPAAGRP